jgi:CheY-like chemotaxis protein
MKKKLNCILLIDDDEATNFLNQLVIEQCGYVDKVIIKQSGREALEYLSSVSSENKMVTRPDVIFLDINMPAMDGWEFLEEYKKLNEEQKGKMMIVMLTTSLFKEDKERAASVPGVSGFENKPLTKEKLESVMEVFFNSTAANEIIPNQ